jgi:hypothetical protein
VPPRARAPAGARWAAIGTLGEEALPNLMRKVIAHALDGRTDKKRWGGRDGGDD